MKIIIFSEFLGRGTGGTSTVTEILAGEFAKMEHQVVIVTCADWNSSFLNYSVPINCVKGFTGVLRKIHRADRIYSIGFSRKLILAGLILRIPTFVHHAMVSMITSPTFIDRYFMGKVFNVAPSLYLQNKLPKGVTSGVIVNPYDQNIFRLDGVSRIRSGILFVGRLVKGKGIECLIESYAKSSVAEKLYIVGEGELRDTITARINDLNLSEEVKLLGSLCPAEVSVTMRSCRLLVVPSIEPEAFGIVAIEGVACGIKVIVSNAGALPEAVGSYAQVFNAGDIYELSKLISQSILDDHKLEIQKINLYKFSPPVVASQYLHLENNIS